MPTATAAENRVNGQTSVTSVTSENKAEYKPTRSATTVILSDERGERSETLTVPEAVNTDAGLMAFLTKNPSVAVKSRAPTTRGESGRSEYKPSSSYTGATMRAKLLGVYGFAE